MDKSKEIWIFNHYETDSLVGEQSRHYRFAKNLVDDGFKVRIFCASSVHNTSKNLITDKRKYYEESPCEGITYVVVRARSYVGNGLGRILNMYDYYKRLRSIYKKFPQPLCIIGSSVHPLASLAALKISKKLKCPNIVEIRDLWPLSIVEFQGVSEKNLLIRWLYRLEKKLYVKSDALIFTMEGGGQYIVDKKWDKLMDMGKIFHINNGISVAEQDELTEQCKYENEVFDNDDFKVLYTGSIRIANKVDTIVSTAEYLEKTLNEKNVRFIIYGDGDNRQALMDRCAERDIRSVHFMGRIEKKYIPSILRKGDLAILTYQNVGTWKYGGSQNKLFDYLNAGLPVLTNIKMGFSVLDRENCGFETDSDDPEVLAKAIIEAKNMPRDEYIAMRERARSTAEQYDFRKLTDKLEAVIDYVMDKE